MRVSKKGITSSLYNWLLAESPSCLKSANICNYQIVRGL